MTDVYPLSFSCHLVDFESEIVSKQKRALRSSLTFSKPPLLQLNSTQMCRFLSIRLFSKTGFCIFPFRDERKFAQVTFLFCGSFRKFTFAKAIILEPLTFLRFLLVVRVKGGARDFLLSNKEDCYLEDSHACW